MLREAGGGGIINVASAASFSAAPGMAAYNVSKAGVLSLSETLAAELSRHRSQGQRAVPHVREDQHPVRTAISDDARAALASNADAAHRDVGRQGRADVSGPHDRGGLYVVPQLDAKLVWQLKRHPGRIYTLGAGLLGRFGPLRDEPPRSAPATN